MAVSTIGYEEELGTLSEWEDEYEAEAEGEWEEELPLGSESEEFIQQLAALARTGTPSPALKRIALRAARSALAGAGSAGARAVFAGSPGRLLRQAEFEAEDESEWELAEEAYTDALMEHLAHAAAESESEAEAEAFIGALVPLAAKALPLAAKALPALTKAAPHLISGVANVAQSLFRGGRKTRPLMRALPRVVKGATQALARQASQGQPITPQQARRVLAQQTARTIGNPQQAARVLRRSQAVDRRFHRARFPAVSVSIGPVYAR